MNVSKTRGAAAEPAKLGAAVTATMTGTVQAVVHNRTT